MILLSTLVTSILESTGGNLATATDQLYAAVMDNDDLYQQLMDPLVRNACYDAVRAGIHVNRARIWNNTEKNRSSRLSAYKGLYDFPLPHNGKLLGDATWSDVDQAEIFYGKQAEMMSYRQRWLAVVKQRLPQDNSKSVRQKIKEKDLRKLQDIAKGQQ